MGQVHLGVVHLFDLDGDDVAANEAPITALAFLSREELAERRGSLETWSQICFDHLNLLMP